jgi:hypothetical protein
VEVTAQNGEAFVHLHTNLYIYELLTAKQIVEEVEAIAIGLGGAEKVNVTFDHPI